MTSARCFGLGMMLLALGCEQKASKEIQEVGPAKQIQEGHYYPVQVGNTWTYRSGKDIGETKVVSCETDPDKRVAALESTRDGKVISTEKIIVSKTGIHRSKNTLLADEPYLLLKLPPKTGDSWNAEIGFFTGAFTVSFADVEVPFGKFKDAVLVTIQLPSSVESKWWCVADIGMVKQVTKRADGGDPIVTELLKFVPGK
jgi:hypothetical protein